MLPSAVFKVYEVTEDKFAWRLQIFRWFAYWMLSQMPMIITNYMHNDIAALVILILQGLEKSYGI